MEINYVPLLMFVSLIIGLFIGIPIAFVLGFISIIFAYFLWGVGGMSLLINAAWGTMNNFPLLAIPLFIFMALMLQKSEVVSDLYDTFYKWSGGLRGGLAAATIGVGAVLGAVSGVIAAGVVGLGLVALPQMLKYKYDKNISMGSVMAGGTLGQLIPPSVNMIVYGVVTGVSVGGLFAGGLWCGVILALLYIAYILIKSFINKKLCPSLPPGKRATWREKIVSLKEIIGPSLLILTVLGAIFSGATTPTEAAAVGALGAIVFSLIMRRFTWLRFKESAIDTLKITSMVGWIIIGASAFGSVFSGVGGNQLVTQIAMSLPGGRWGVLALSIIFVLFLGMFLETTAMIMLAAPIISPLLIKFGFDPLWWGLVFNVLLQVAFISPPFGFALFYLRGVTPKGINIEDIYMSVLPFIVLQLIFILLMLLFPNYVVWLPRLLFK
ncbi:MAG TPA: TRAP transporter large permease subunit [Candidatus Atribacteria bacterium]|nr:TRAP transporter large permease subunit [Candidatus Atribacteria bacterium]